MDDREKSTIDVHQSFAKDDRPLVDPMDIDLSINHKPNEVEHINGKVPESTNASYKSYTNYVSKKAKDAERRRNLNERIEKLRSVNGITLNVPQCKNITPNQLAMFLRRYRKLPDAKMLMSTQLQQNVFQDDKPKQLNGFCPQQQLFTSHIGRKEHTQGSVLERYPLKAKDGIDSGETTEYSTDSENETPISTELYHSYLERTQILSADARAAALQKRLLEEQQRAQFYSTMVLDDEFKFGEGSQNERMDCARCRPLTERPGRKFICHKNPSKSSDHSQPMSAKTACGNEDYARVDDSIHAFLSSPSLTSVELKIQKYLHVVGTIPPEIEIRRQKTARLCTGADEKLSRVLYKLICEERPTTSGAPNDSKNYGKISISLSKNKKQKNSSVKESESTATSDEDNDADYPLMQRVRRHLGHLNNMSSDRSSKKSGSVNDRRHSSASNREFGRSDFDYDLVDIGLVNFQNVDCQEIIIPSFRKVDREVDAHSCPLSYDDCFLRPHNNPWQEIISLHGELEAQEKLRFKPVVRTARTGSHV